MRLKAESCLQPKQTELHGFQSATALPEAEDLGSKKHSVFWLAELGKADSAWLYNGMDNTVDFCKTGVGIAFRLNWSLWEKEVALYESPHAHYSEWLEISPVVEEELHFSSLNAVRGRGGHPGLPLGIAPGSMLQQLMKRDAALRKEQ